MPFSPELLQKAQESWGRRGRKPLALDETTQALTNLVGFGQALLEAHQEIQRRQNPPLGKSLE